jgi:hypothetical protein
MATAQLPRGSYKISDNFYKRYKRPKLATSQVKSALNESSKLTGIVSHGDLHGFSWLPFWGARMDD